MLIKAALKQRPRNAKLQIFVACLGGPFAEERRDASREAEIEIEIPATAGSASAPDIQRPRSPPREDSARTRAPIDGESGAFQRAKKACKHIVFWHNIPDREDDHASPRRLIANAKTRVSISGITLTFIIKDCAEELERALERGVEVTLIIADDNEDSHRWYEHYSSEVSTRLRTAHILFRRFVKRLPDRLADRMHIRFTRIPMTHSVGMYDKQAFVSEFCLQKDAAAVPSYCVREGCDAYRVFERELKYLADTGRRLSVTRLLTIDCWDTLLVDNPDWDQAVRRSITSWLRSRNVRLEASLPAGSLSGPSPARPASELDESRLDGIFAEEARWFSHLMRENKSLPDPGATRVRFILDKLDVAADHAEVKDLFASIQIAISDHAPIAVEGARLFLEHVKERGLKTCLISNTGWFSGVTVRRALEECGLARYLDHMVFADEVVRGKPGREIFEHALAKSGCIATQTLHIGNNVRTDIVGALECGLSAIHFARGADSAEGRCPSFATYEAIEEYLKTEASWCDSCH